MEDGQDRGHLDSILREGHVSVYDFKGHFLPDLLNGKSSGQVRMFHRAGKRHGIQSAEFQVQYYEGLSEIRYAHTDVHLLDGEAIRLLFAHYPQNAPYALARIALRSGWLIGLPGLIRRLAKGHVRLRGIATLKSNGESQRWLVIEFRGFQTSDSSLSCEVGVQGFLDYLREEGVRYVVLRFYDKLPELYQKHGDLDLQIEDEEEGKIRSFLRAHPGPIPVDPWTISSGHYPPPLAARILKNAVDGPAGSRIPAPKDAFQSFAYHAVYDVGFSSGIPSCLPAFGVNPNLDNDYATILAEMAWNLDIQVPIELESLDEYLHQEGWRPGLGSFARFASGNEWVCRRFLSHRHAAEMGLGVFILKEKALKLGLVDKILEEIELQGFVVLRNKNFDEGGKRVALTSLRGGNWQSFSGETLDEYSPAIALVVLDIRPFSIFHSARGTGVSRSIPLKMALRRRFDQAKTSIVHSTDNSYEAWQYIEVCFPEDCDAIRSDIDEYLLKFRVRFSEAIRFHIELMLHRARHFRVRHLTRQSGRTLARFLMK